MDCDKLANALGGKKNGDGWLACCPAHVDKTPSLSIDKGNNGTPLFFCHAGCSQEQVIDALRTRGLWKNKKNNQIAHPTKGQPNQVWTYRSSSQHVIGYACRFNKKDGGKDVLPFTRQSDGKWKWRAFPEPRPLYALDQLYLKPETPVFIVEGEKAADAAQKLFPDYVVTTWPGGCKAVSKANWPILKGRKVSIWPDADEPGRKAAAELARLFPGASIITPPESVKAGWDAADALDGGWTAEQIRKLVSSKPTQEAESSTPNILEIDPSAPYDNALIFVRKKYRTENIRTLQYWQGSFYKWDGSAYISIKPDDIKSELYDFFKSAVFIDKDGNQQPFKPTRNKIADLLDAIKAVANLSCTKTPPCWLNDTNELAAVDIIPCRNGLFHLPTQILHKPDPAFFALSALPFDYDADAEEPKEWLNFLNSIWEDDQEQIETLQEIFGYFLTSDTTQQKIFLLVGPKRSGKGTMARVLRELLGTLNVAGPTLSSLSQQFGLAPLIGKKLAIISDARLSSRIDQHSITERLLSISGEDCLGIPRKYLPDYTAQLDTRFLIMTNELPRLADASGALASRFIILSLLKSFYGKEDPGLTTKLLKELPAILNWSITGAQRLFLRGHFIQPGSCAELIEELADLTSPVSAFVRDCCVVDPIYEIETKRLYLAWKDWCEEQGRDYPGTIQSFGRDLRAAITTLNTAQLRRNGEIIRVYRGLTLKSMWNIREGM